MLWTNLKQESENSSPVSTNRDMKQKTTINPKLLLMIHSNIKIKGKHQLVIHIKLQIRKKKDKYFYGKKP